MTSPYPDLNQKTRSEKWRGSNPKLRRIFGQNATDFPPIFRFKWGRRGNWKKSLILGYAGSFFAPKYGNPPSGMRFVLPGIFGLLCVTKINKKVFNEARLEKYPINTYRGARFDFL